MHIIETKGILSAENGINVYRGCMHGCIYCDSRSNCYQMKHQFEDIEVKGNAPRLLEEALRRKRKRCMIGTGAMSDPYIPLEEKIRNTRKCLEIIEKYGFGLAILTKSSRILRDLDLLKRIQFKSKCVVQMTLTTYDEQICKKIEPNVSSTAERVEVLKAMHDNGIETVVWLTPILPFINDTRENLLGILDYCTKAHVRRIISFGMGMTLREGNREYFYQKLDELFPGMKETYINTYGNAYQIGSPKARELNQLFYSYCKAHGMITDTQEIFRYMRTYEEKAGYEQLSLFL